MWNEIANKKQIAKSLGVSKEFGYSLFKLVSDTNFSRFQNSFSTGFLFLFLK